MVVFNGVFPIKPGKEKEAREFAAEVSGPRYADFDAHFAQVGITRETWTLQETPMGSFIVVWFEGTLDVEKVFTWLATDDSEYTKWFRGRVLDVTGVDMTQPGGPPPDVLVDWPA